MKKTKVLAVICAISMFVGGCQSDPKKQIIGTWEFDEGFTITFMDDGTFLDDDGLSLIHILLMHVLPVMARH